MIPREADFTATKQESSAINDNAKRSNASSSSTTSWSRFKDPRIVRVSRAFGGKDRHSKVCTVKGLRDRRVRLSVPTAIQLYDLQERLGLNQPSKVVDWLLNAAKHEIDELPPLQIPQGISFMQDLTSHESVASQSDKQGLKISSSFNWSDPMIKSKDVSGETSDRNEITWARNEEESRQFNLENQGEYNVSTNNFLSRQNPSSLPSLMNNTAPYSPFLRWDPSNLTLSHPPISLGLMASAQHDQDLQNFNLVQFPSAHLSTPSRSHQVLVYQPGVTTQPYFPSPINAPMNTEFDQKQPDFQSSELSNSSFTSPVHESTTHL